MCSRPDASLNSAIWAQIQSKWNWQNYESVTIKRISPALPFKADSNNFFLNLIKRAAYLLRKFFLSFFIIWQVGRYEGIVLETLFSFKGELFLEELFLGCFQKTVLDAGQIERTIEKLNADNKYDLDLDALEQKIQRMKAYFSLVEP
ncbi:MAG: hypothetical protein HQM13_16475 [SAR324 cluster bacterium]|nr:hypothetical protein [SAR324 cluster bacterium]